MSGAPIDDHAFEGRSIEFTAGTIAESPWCRHCGGHITSHATAIVRLIRRWRRWREKMRERGLRG